MLKDPCWKSISFSRSSPKIHSQNHKIKENPEISNTQKPRNPKTQTKPSLFQTINNKINQPGHLDSLNQTNTQTQKNTAKLSSLNQTRLIDFFFFFWFHFLGLGIWFSGLIFWVWVFVLMTKSIFTLKVKTKKKLLLQLEEPSKIICNQIYKIHKKNSLLSNEFFFASFYRRIFSQKLRYKKCNNLYYQSSWQQGYRSGQIVIKINELGYMFKSFWGQHHFVELECFSSEVCNKKRSYYTK